MKKTTSLRGISLDWRQDKKLPNSFTYDDSDEDDEEDVHSKKFEQCK
jgi:hypothetical protein